MKRIFMLIGMILVLALAAGCGKAKENTQASAISLGAQTENQAVEVYGVIKASDVRDVVVDFPAYVESINVKEGQTVNKGETLMTLNVNDFKAQINEKESELDLLEDQNKGSSLLDGKIKTLEESLKLLKGKLNQGNIKQNLVVSDAAKGLVYDMGYIKGDITVPGKKLLSIANLDSIVVCANVDQQFINQVETGAKVDIVPEYNKGTVYNGTVIFISTKALQNNGETTIPVEITFDEKVQGLIIDSDVQVKIYPLEQNN